MTTKNQCWMCPAEQPPCFIVLGRYGDIIQLLPAFKAVHDRTGLKPIVMTSTHYMNVLDGVSYVTPHPIDKEWWSGVPFARQLASDLYGGGVVPQWWADDPYLWGTKQSFKDLFEHGNTVLQSHGHGWGVDMADAPDYGTSMWQRAGFTPTEMMSLPLVFDRRDGHREGLLTRQHQGRGDKPLLLLSFDGKSSPFGPYPEVMEQVNKFAHRFHFVMLGSPSGSVKAARIFDLLGLMDAAAGMITIDTASLHLALASKVPYIAYTRGPGDWCRSVPKGNCVKEIHYGHATQRLNEIAPILEGWAGGRSTPRLVGAGGGGVCAI